MDTTTEYETSSLRTTNETLNTTDENVYTTPSSTNATPGLSETNTAVLVTSSGTQRPYTESASPGPLEDTETMPEEPASDVGLTVGVVVGVIMVLVIAAVVVVIIVCRWHKKKKQSKDSPVRKISSTRAPGMKTINAREHRPRAALDIQEEEDDNEDEGSCQRHSNTTFKEIQAQASRGVESANTTEEPRKGSILNLPDIRDWSRQKREMSKKSSSRKISETVQEPVGYDEKTGLPIYIVQKPTDRSTSSPRKKSIQKALGLRKDSYPVNPDERKGSLFQLPDISGIMTKMKKGKSKNKSRNPKYDISEEDERVPDQHVIHKTDDLPSGAVYNDLQNVNQMTRMSERETPDPYASSSHAIEHSFTEEEYTALQVGEPNIDDEVTEAQTTKQSRLESDEDTGRYSVEYANYGASSRPSSLTNESTMAELPGHPEHAEPDRGDPSYRVEYMNLKAAGKAVSDSVSGEMTEASGVTYQGDSVCHTSETSTEDKRASSIYVNASDVHISSDLIVHNGDGSNPSHSETYGSDPKPQDKLSSVLPVQKVEYPLDYTPSDTQRPSGPYMNVPEPLKKVPDTVNMSNSHEDLFKRYS